MYSLVIRNGVVVDGTGTPARRADVAVDGERIVAVGDLSDAVGEVEIDARGAHVLPGWVDVHTHYDAQATWDQVLAPSSWHGVTTAVMGNCGVGFAPVAPDGREMLVAVMEGVEDIPGAVLDEGLSWRWRSFGDYLDVLDAKSYTMDVCAQVPHTALRTYAMGERGARHREAPTPEQAAQMSEMVAAALEAGAIGLSTSRTRQHRSRTGEEIPTLTAPGSELGALAEGLRRAGRGVIQAIGDFDDLDLDFELLRTTAELSGQPMSISVTQRVGKTDEWRRILDLMAASTEAGVTISAQVAARPVGLLMGLCSTWSPFDTSPTYASLAGLELAERVEQMRRSDVRSQIIDEVDLDRAVGYTVAFDRMFALGEEPDYVPDYETSIGAEAQRSGRNPFELAYDTMLELDGEGFIYAPSANWTKGNVDVIREMLLDERAVPGLSDAGAHCGLICDASFPTFLVSYWARDRGADRLPLEHVVKKQTHDTARLVGLADRGTIEVGMRADLNVVDVEALEIHAPRAVYDLPAGGRRLVQRATGYAATVVRGTVTHRDGVHTGALPGRLVRGAQAA